MTKSINLRTRGELQDEIYRLQGENMTHREKPVCPWPKEIWPMTDEEYVKAVPDPRTRTAISGFLMRLGWEAYERHLTEKEQHVS